MMATFVDEQDVELQDDEQLDMFEETDTVSEPEEQSDQLDIADEDDNDIPEKYRGKSPKEIIRMHQEAEKLLGRQSSEVGELRKVVDNFILTQTQETQKPKEEEADVDFFTDPDAYTRKAIDSNPKIKEFEQMTAQLKKETALNKLQSMHPDWQQHLGSEDFGKWVQGSKIRMEMFARADRNYDFDAANELLTTWKERIGAVEKTREVEANEIKRQRKAAATGSGKGGGEGKSRKVYRRSDIINLMQTDPDRYAALSDEIMKAYQEGRVKG